MYHQTPSGYPTYPLPSHPNNTNNRIQQSQQVYPHPLNPNESTPANMVKMQAIQRKSNSYTYRTIDSRSQQNESIVQRNDGYRAHSAYISQPQKSRQVIQTYSPLKNDQFNRYSAGHQFTLSKKQQTSPSFGVYQNQYGGRNSVPSFELKTKTTYEQYYPELYKGSQYQTQPNYQPYPPIAQIQPISSSYLKNSTSNLKSSTTNLKNSTTNLKNSTTNLKNSTSNLKRSDSHANSSSNLHKSGHYMNSYYENLVENTDKVSNQQRNQIRGYQYSEDMSEKAKLSQITQDMAKMSLERGQLLLEVAGLIRENNQLKKENQKLKEEVKTERNQKQTFRSKAAKAESQRIAQLQAQLQAQKSSKPAGIFISQQMVLEIQAIKKRELQLSKIKKQFLLMLDNKYHDQIQKLNQTVALQRQQIQNSKTQLMLLRQTVKEKEIKLEIAQKQLQALQKKWTNQSKSIRQKLQVQLNDKNSQIQLLRHSLTAIEGQYRAQRKQIADKDDFITKYMTNRTGQNAQSIQLLIDKYNFYARQQFQSQSTKPQ